MAFEFFAEDSSFLFFVHDNFSFFRIYHETNLFVYLSVANSVIADEIYRLRGEKETAMVKNSGYASQKQRMADMIYFLQKQNCIVEEYDEQLVRKLVDTVTIFDEKLTVTFKSGLMVNLEM